MTRLCVSIFVESVEQARRDVARAIEADADLIELRIDLLTDAAEVRSVVEGLDANYVLTCRAEWEGGQSELPDDERVALLTAANAAVAGHVDVEWQTIRTCDAALPRPTVASYHDFTTRPADLTKTYLSMCESPAADVVKVAWSARSLRDNLEAFELMLTRPRPTVAICMGEAGQLSRILAKKFGAWATFASLDARTVTAPGQVTAHDLKAVYRWDRVGPATKVYGVVGSPVGHSMSPAIHNAAFDAVGHDGLYVPLLVEAGYESFKAFMETFTTFAPLHLSGLSVTIPHKENALRYAREKGWRIDPLAERIGAANTIWDLGRDGATPSVTSTDYAAILDTIAAGLGVGRDGLRDLRVAVVEAGGTGRTAVAALMESGATVDIYNRTHDRAATLAAEFAGAMARPWGDLSAGAYDVLVNATSVGMSPKSDASLFDPDPPAKLSADQLVFDTVYNPIETKLIRQAREAGARTAGGVEMFVRQAAGQLEQWTGRAAPAELMRRVVEARLRGG